jgi:hypothetical protein
LADDGLIQPNAIVEEYTVRAREANASLRKTWDCWIENGRPIYAFEHQLEDEVIPNDPEQRPQDTQRWRESMGAFLRREGWHESQPTGFTKAERTNLMHILARLDEVQAYRTRFGQTKGEQKLQRHNSPSQVWRSFLKDIGELQTKEGGKKSTLKESVVELQEQVDELSAENERLTDAVNESGWEAQITAIVEKVDPKEVADAVYGGTERPVVMELTDAMVRRYADMAKCEPPASTMELLMNARRLADPQAFVKDNSQKARQYADAILNQLDGQTDETNDERLAWRIVNGRGPAAAQSLAQAIVALIQKRIDPEESEQPAAEPLAGHPQDATQASVEGVSEVEEDEAAIAERLAASMTDDEKIAAKERMKEIIAQAKKGDVLVTGTGHHLGDVPADDPRATGWNVTFFDPACSVVKGFSPREVADAKAETIRQFPVEFRPEALLYDPGHPKYPTLVETPAPAADPIPITAEQVREAAERVKWSARSTHTRAKMQEGLPKPIPGEIAVLGHVTKHSNAFIPKDHPGAGWWYLYCGETNGGWRSVKEYREGFGTLADAEVAAAAYTAALAAEGVSAEPARSKWEEGNSGRVWVVNPDGTELVFFTAEAAASSGVVVHEQPAENFDLAGCHIYCAQYVPKPRTTKSVVRIKGEVLEPEEVEPDAEKQLLEWVGTWLRDNPGRRGVEAGFLIQAYVAKMGGVVTPTKARAMIRKIEPQKRGRKPKTTEPPMASHASREPVRPPNPPSAPGVEDDGDGLRFGQKRIVGKSNGSYVPVDMVDDPWGGEVERYFLEVYQATDLIPEGAWIRVGGDGWATRDEAAKFL